MTKTEQINLLRDALADMVNEAQPAGIDRPVYRAALNALQAAELPAVDELPPEGAEYFFEGERWVVSKYLFYPLGYPDLQIWLEQIKPEAPPKSTEFELEG
jgi:hypothetical protein